jgi:hypothetical protein
MAQWIVIYSDEAILVKTHKSCKYKAQNFEQESRLIIKMQLFFILFIQRCEALPCFTFQTHQTVHQKKYKPSLATDKCYLWDQNKKDEISASYRAENEK